MFAELTCANCGAVLACALKVLPLADPAEAGLDYVDQKPLTPSGVVFLSSHPMQWSDDPTRKPALQFNPQHWLNPADVENAVEPVTDPRRLNGCCGLDGSDGPNMRCRNCKAEVGTRQSDCWTSDVFIPAPGAISWQEAGR